MKLEQKHYGWGMIIIVAILVIAFWKQISDFMRNLLSIGSAGASTRSSNPTIQGFKNRATDISSRLTILIDDTNSKLNAAGIDGQIFPNQSSKIPSGLCKCWSILWGAFGYYTKKCCDAGNRVSLNQKEDAILADFRSKAALIESDGTKLGSDIDSTFPSSSIARQKKGCCCAWIVYYGIGFCVGRHLQTCCGE